jgi:glycerol uptake facilitator protein
VDTSTILISEIIGTMLLILLGDGVVANVVLSKTKGNSSGWIVITTAWAMAVFVGAYVSVTLGGQAHLNPAVTVGVALNGGITWAQAPIFFIGEFVGAMIGALLVWIAYYQHFGATEDKGLKLAVFCTAPAIRNPVWNLLTEIIGTFVLMYAIFAIQPAAGGLGSFQLAVVAWVVWVIGLALGGPTGYAINPARDLGPRIMHAILPIQNKGGSDWGYSWVPVIGPIIGAVLAYALWVAL